MIEKMLIRKVNNNPINKIYKSALKADALGKKLITPTV